MSLYAPTRWLFVVRFARDTSPSSPCCAVNVIAATPEDAVARAWPLFRATWRDDSKFCAVLSVQREEPIHSEETP